MVIAWILSIALILTALLVITGIKKRYHLYRFLFNKPRIIQLTEYPSAKYTPQILDRLVLPDTIRGMVGIRQWICVDDILTSRNKHYIWTSNKMVADKIPTKNNRHGIYSYQLGSVVPFWPQHIGIVEMLDHIEVHSDGVVRAEKCKILAIIVNWGHSRLAREISSRYNIPVYSSNYPILAFKEWLLGSDGIKWLNHNYNLLHPTRFKIVEEAEKLLGAQ
jgi:hypothetical protein